MAAAHSAVTRILSASTASWLRIGVTVLTQLALVPLYLAQWDAQTYGAWLLLQAVCRRSPSSSLAHHDYVGYACLQLRAERRAAIARKVFSAAPWVVLIALWDVSLAWLLGRADFLAGWVGDDGALLAQWRAALLLQALTWLATAPGWIDRALAHPVWLLAAIRLVGRRLRHHYRRHAGRGRGDGG